MELMCGVGLNPVVWWCGPTNERERDGREKRERGREIRLPDATQKRWGLRDFFMFMFKRFLTSITLVIGGSVHSSRGKLR